MTIALIIICILLVASVTMAVRLMIQVRRQRQLREEAETSKQQALAEQKRNQQLKQEMTSNIAHELKTPVSSIRGFLEILQGDKPLDEQQRRYFLERCYSQTLRLSDLIADVALINKLEEANDLFEMEPVSVNECAEEAIVDLAHQASQHNITILNALPADMEVSGDRSLLYTIFRNLIENAITHAGDGSEVTVDSYQPADGERYYLRVSDNGRGVSSEYLPKLFDRFVRIDEGRSRKNGGTGLGLSIVKHAVQLHGGTVYAKNRPEPKVGDRQWSQPSVSGDRQWSQPSVSGGLEVLFSLKIEK